MTAFTPSDSASMMHPAMTTPRKMAGKLLRSRIPSREATSAPVQAPVPGSGLATRIISPRNSPRASTYATDR